ncbi:MAG: hypothetical protein HY866_20245 [Chloroflexi bacterium]|nr:hypothetical protein [Chloroflexota bacterium]
MRSRYTLFAEPDGRFFLLFVLSLAVIMAAFLLLVGLGPDRLPFPPESEYSDAAISHWPNAVFLRRAVLDDHALPLWRSLIMSGQPFASNPLNKVWYPPQWFVLLLPPALHLNLLTWLHLVIAGAGMWVWARATGLLPWPAVLAGIGYAFAPRLIAAVGAGHLDLVYAAAWFPWLLWAVHRMFSAAPPKNSVLVAAGFGALCFLADVRLSAYGFVSAAVYAVWLWQQTSELRVRRTLIRVLRAALILAGLTAVQWVPLLMLRADLSRGSLTLDEAAAESLQPGQWIGLLIGDHGGAWESMVYVGISTLVLAITALLLRPRALALWGIILLGVMAYAMGNHFVVWTALNRVFPALRWWRVPPRAWLVAALILPYLAGWGAQLLAERPIDRRAARLGVVALFGGGMVCGLFSTATLSGTLEITATLGTFALPAVALIMLLAIFGKLPPRLLAAGFALVVALDVIWIDRTLVEGRRENEWLEPYRPLAEYLKQAGAARVYSPSYSLSQQAAAYWEIPQFGGVDPFQLQNYVKAAEAAVGVAAEGYSITIPAYHDDDPETKKTASELLATANQDARLNPDLLGEWLVSHVVSAFEIQADGLVLDTRIGDVYVYRNTRMPDVMLSWHGPNRVTIQTTRPYSGTLYAVAGGRWKDQAETDTPGLPGVVDGSVQRWDYEYDAAEVWISLLAAASLIALSAGLWWGAGRE